MRDVGYHDCRGGFACVPVQVNEGAVAGSEVIVSVQDRCQNDEDSEREDSTEDEFPLEGQTRFNEER